MDIFHQHIALSYACRSECRFKRHLQLPYPFRQNQRMQYVRFPLADHVCHTKPTQSGKSYFSSDCLVAVSQNELEPVLNYKQNTNSNNHDKGHKYMYQKWKVTPTFNITILLDTHGDELPSAVVWRIISSVNQRIGNKLWLSQ